jgi:hypothetical protein
MSAVTRYRGPRIRTTKQPQQYPYMQYPYQNVGTQLTWRDQPPQGYRTAPDSLGDYLPVPGGPEEIPIAGGYSGYVAVGADEELGDCGCGCKGAGTCGKSPLSGVPGFDQLDAMLRPTLGGATTPVVAAAGLGLAYLLYKTIAKR